MTVPAAVLAFAAVLWLAALIWLQVLHTMRDPKPVPIILPPHVTGVVWGRRVYPDVRSLRRALRARGINYQAWARTHPAAMRILRGEARRH